MKAKAGQRQTINKKKQKIINVEDIKGQLINLAHQGDEEAVERLRNFIQNEKNEDLREWAEIALDEAEFFYYSPQNNQEEEDFLLARSICRRQKKLWSLESRADGARLELKELGLDKKVYQKVLKTLTNKDQIKEWQYNFSDDYCFMVKDRLAKISAETAYEVAWLETARQFIKIKKYQLIPDHIFDHIHFDADGIDFWEDKAGLGGERDVPSGLINYINNPK